MVDVALRLRPYMRASMECKGKDKKSLETSNRLKQQKQKPQPNRKRRPANLPPPARLAFRQRRQRSKQQKQNTTTQRGQSPNKNTYRRAGTWFRRAWRSWRRATSMWLAWHKLTSTLISRGRRGTTLHLPSFCVARGAHMALGGALGLGLGARDARDTVPLLRGRRGTNSHPPSFHVAHMAEPHIYHRLRCRHGTYGTGWRAWIRRAGRPWRCASSAWQTWHLVTSTLISRRRCGNNLTSIFFSVQRLHGFRQVVPHVWEHVAISINWLIKSRKGHCCSGRNKLVEDRCIVLCTVTLNKKTRQNTKKQRNKDQKQHQTQTENKHTKTQTLKPNNKTHHNLCHGDAGPYHKQKTRPQKTLWANSAGVGAETRDLPTKIPEITKSSLHGMTYTLTLWSKHRQSRVATEKN